MGPMGPMPFSGTISRPCEFGPILLWHTTLLELIDLTSPTHYRYGDPQGFPKVFWCSCVMCTQITGFHQTFLVSWNCSWRFRTYLISMNIVNNYHFNIFSCNPTSWIISLLRNSTENLLLQWIISIPGLAKTPACPVPGHELWSSPTSALSGNWRVQWVLMPWKRNGSGNVLPTGFEWNTM